MVGVFVMLAAVLVLRLRARRRACRAVRTLAGERLWSERQALQRAQRNQRHGAMWRRLDASLARTAPGHTLRALLMGAGLPRLSVGRFALYSLASAMVGALLAFIASWIWADGGNIYPAVGSLVGLIAPLMVVRVRRQRRLESFAKQLPEATDALASALKAGASLPQGVERVARELRAPISDELRRVLAETQYGLSWADALHNMQRRTAGGSADADVPLLVSAIAVQQSVGGDLVNVLRTLSETMRERMRLRGEIQIHTAQGRYQAYVIAALPVLLFTFFWFTNRAYISVLFEPHMRHFLFGAMGLMAAGFFTMKRIVALDI